MHTCVRPEASCVPVRLCRGGPRSGRSTAGSGRTRGRQTGLPELSRIDSRSAGFVSGWSRHSPGNVSCRESASAARLSCPGMWTARSDLNCVWLQRRRWRASCDMRCDRIPPCRLIYETAAVLSVRTSTCLPNSSGRNCHILTELPGSRTGLARGAWGGMSSPNRTLLATGKMGRGREWGGRASHTVVPWTWEPGGNGNCSFFEKVGTTGPWTSGGTETKRNRRFSSRPSTGGRSGAVLAVSWERANSNISGLPGPLPGLLRRLPGRLGAWLGRGGRRSPARGSTHRPMCRFGLGRSSSGGRKRAPTATGRLRPGPGGSSGWCITPGQDVLDRLGLLLYRRELLGEALDGVAEQPALGDGGVEKACLVDVLHLCQ